MDTPAESPRKGALLTALDLPPPKRHKMGVGKPLGLGTVKLTPHLILQTRTPNVQQTARYDTLRTTLKTSSLAKLATRGNNLFSPEAIPSIGGGNAPVSRTKRVSYSEGVELNRYAATPSG